ncbi:MAG: hypothetical protein R2708_10900 [Vicinamibacterales bacterium]
MSWPRACPTTTGGTRLFTRMFERGLAYRRRSTVNWCPSCQTVLANEQVVDGGCWRCGTTVVEKDLEQWFFKITAYADDLLQGIDGLRVPGLRRSRRRCSAT